MDVIVVRTNGSSMAAQACVRPHHRLTVPLQFSDPSGVDPEEALVAALSSCHMLFFLSFAAKEGFVVASYDDCAVGILDKTPEGKEWMAKVTLRPCVVFEGERRRNAGKLKFCIVDLMTRATLPTLSGVKFRSMGKQKVSNKASLSSSVRYPLFQ